MHRDRNVPTPPLPFIPQQKNKPAVRRFPYKVFLFEVIFSSPGCMSLSRGTLTLLSSVLRCLPLLSAHPRAGTWADFVLSCWYQRQSSPQFLQDMQRISILAVMWPVKYHTHISDTMTAVNRSKQHPLLVWAVDMSGWWSLCLKKLSRRLRQNPLGSQNELEGFSISCSEIISLLKAAVLHRAAHTFLIFPSPASKLPQEIIKRKMTLNGLSWISSTGGSPAF